MLPPIASDSKSNTESEPYSASASEYVPSSGDSVVEDSDEYENMASGKRSLSVKRKLFQEHEVGISVSLKHVCSWS